MIKNINNIAGTLKIVPVFSIIAILSLYILTSSIAKASPVNFGADYFDKNKLYTDKQWLSLLHFDGKNSIITSNSFFLDTENNPDPKRELIATIEAMSLPESDFLTNRHPQCLFPARRLWIKTRLGEELSLPNVKCPDLENWEKDYPIESISLIFVSGYLSNPASFFGHVLLKLNKSSSDESESSPLLDLSVNYGASVGINDGPIKYISYGLLGGYDAEYTIDDYFIYDATYAELESREMWEYELNLSQLDIKLIQLHLWELKGQKIDYYFLNRNCATQLSYLIQMVTGESLVTNHQPWDMPIDIFKNIVNQNNNGKPLVKNIKKRESKYNRLHNKYLSLSQTEKDATYLISQSVSNFESLGYINLNDTSKARVISVLYDFIEIKKQESLVSDLEYNQIKRQLLLENFKITTLKLNWNSKESAPPHLSQNPNKFGLSLGYNSNLGSFEQLNFRLGYYDYLFLESSRNSKSNITFLDTELRNYRGKVILNKFDFFDISTLNVTDVDLFDNQKFSWKIKLTVENDDLSCQECLKTRFYSGIGISKSFLKNINAFAIPITTLDLGNIKESTLGTELGILYTSSSFIKTYLSITPIILKQKGNPSSLTSTWETRFGNSSNWDIRFQLDYNVEFDSSLELAWYF